MAVFRGSPFDEELVWGRVLRSDDRFCFQCLRVPGEQQDKFLRWDVVSPCWSIDGTSCACQFGTKLEAWNWYRNHPSLADLPFQEGDEVLHQVLSDRVASLRREVMPRGASAQYLSLPELFVLFLAYSFWLGDRVEKRLSASVFRLDTYLVPYIVVPCMCFRYQLHVCQASSSLFWHGDLGCIGVCSMFFNRSCRIPDDVTSYGTT